MDNSGEKMIDPSLLPVEGAMPCLPMTTATLVYLLVRLDSHGGLGFR